VRDPEKERHLTDAELPEENRETAVSLLSGKTVAGLNIEDGIARFNGDEEVYINILHSYTTNTRNLLKSISFVTEDKLNSYEITIHSIKGSSFGICADTVGHMAANLEKAAKTGDFSYVTKQNKHFLETAWNLIYSIDNMLESVDSHSPKPKKDKPDSKVVSRLIAACEAYDMDEVDAAMDDITKYEYESDESLVGWLQENVDVMNFDEIVERLGKL